MTNVQVDNTRLQLDKSNLHFTVYKGDTKWKWLDEYVPRIEHEGGTLCFKDASHIEHEEMKSGVGAGIRSKYRGFKTEDGEISYEFETLAWIESATGDVHFEWIPLCEEGIQVKAVYWPGEMSFEEKRADWYTLLNMQQGLLIPNTWNVELGEIVFQGFFGTAGGYMPWFSQIKEREGYIAICTTPWNAGYQAVHPAGGPYTHVGVRFEPSIGKMDYRRVIRYTFLSDCDYNDMCKVYREYVKENGKLRTLAEKAAQIPSVNNLIGSSFIHKGIKTSVRDNSDFYDPKAPDANNHLTTFAEREEEIKKLYEAGARKVYMHLDGWAEPGYDNQHPDYLPACKEAGGWEGLKSLADTMHECGYMFGIHDQYRDYYLAAPSFDEDYACRLADGTIPGHQRWAGGPQSFLCGSQAPFYVKRNYTEISSHEINLDCAYLDVFTCNEGDECSNPRHRVTRKQCCEARNHCFDYLMARGILPSSEEVSDWCVPSMVFSHYAPYDFMLREPGEPRYGVPVPLFNLVYHDCLIAPWMMEKISDTEDYMLYALLNGGAPYLIRDGAYPNIDGSFDGNVKFKMEENIARCKVVSDLHEKVAKCEMVRYEIQGENYNIHKSTFSDGTTVTVDFAAQTYEIKEA